MSNDISSGTRRNFMCISVRGALRDLHQSRKKTSAWFDDNGKALTRLEAIEELENELTKGHEVLPLGSDCNNPCKNADKGCTGFNYGKGGGCPGYWLPKTGDKNDH